MWTVALYQTTKSLDRSKSKGIQTDTNMGPLSERVENIVGIGCFCETLIPLQRPFFSFF